VGPCPNPAASEPLGHDPLGPELAGVVEHDASLRVLQVLVQPSGILRAPGGEMVVMAVAQHRRRMHNVILLLLIGAGSGW
jgi:hypothetical protein